MVMCLRTTSPDTLSAPRDRTCVHLVGCWMLAGTYQRTTKSECVNEF